MPPHQQPSVQRLKKWGNDRSPLFFGRNALPDAARRGKRIVELGCPGGVLVKNQGEKYGGNYSSNGG
ncbi:hypothetical protein MCEGEM3_02179 [Oxalobacteraceae bacterium]